MTFEGRLGHVPCTVMLDSQASKCYASTEFLRRSGFRVPALKSSEDLSPSEGNVRLGDGRTVPVRGTSLVAFTTWLL